MARIGIIGAGTVGTRFLTIAGTKVGGLFG